MRKQTEKYHVLYNGQRRIVRSYATHTMKMAQVSRAICRGLGLNQDFAEAIALGAKLGSVPFVHAAKHTMSKWAEERLRRLDTDAADDAPLRGSGKQQLNMDFGPAEIPAFVTELRSTTVLNKVRQYMPWAAGETSSKLYSSGQEGYWLLCTNPFTVTARRNMFLPDTMYGIWRHSRGLKPGIHPFHHKCFIPGGARDYNEITDQHATFEAIVVQYADDITWVIENLSDANEVAILNEKPRVYDDLCSELDDDLDPSLQQALSRNDTGSIYSYFISDFIMNSQKKFTKSRGDPLIRDALAKGSKEAQIGLSKQAEALLDRMVKYLNTHVFIEPRTKNRTEMLKSISAACVDLIYTGDVLPRVVTEHGRLQRWDSEAEAAAVALLDDPVHRMQASMDVFASWGDQEIYDFVGIQSL